MRQRVDTYPFEVPNAKRIRKNNRSDDMSGVAAEVKR